MPAKTAGVSATRAFLATELSDDFLPCPASCGMQSVYIPVPCTLSSTPTLDTAFDCTHTYGV